MASPQKEHGFTPIANELLEALCRTRISGEARQVLDTVIRRTYGYGKTCDLLALSQISEATGLPKVAAAKAVAKLAAMRLLVVTKKGNKFAPNELSVNKDWEKWAVLPKKVTAGVVTKKGKTLLPKKRNTKESSIYLSDTNKPGGSTKETGEAVGDARMVRDIIEAFTGVNPACKKMYGNTSQRQACLDLVAAHGFERVMLVVEQTLPRTNAMPFFPTITTPHQLFHDWAKLDAAISKYRAKQQGAAASGRGLA